MAVFESGSEAFITMSDDDCNLQSQVTPVLVSGQTVYVRIEGDGDCNGGEEGGPFLVEYMGGIPGCMDIEACNYLPIATSPDTCYLGGDPECPNIGPDLILLPARYYDDYDTDTDEILRPDEYCDGDDTGFDAILRPPEYCGGGNTGAGAILCPTQY